MAITIDWSTRVISVPRADMTLIQLTPTEIRELNLNWFRLQLKDIEDGEEGMVNLDTHKHNTEVSLGGLTYARVIEMINGYTVTFEDGQYAVNLVGANSNVGDVVNVNQVSVRSSNSAGMTSSPDIEYSSYAGGVSLDVTGEYEGTTFPIGTPRRPVNNLADAMLIATFRGFDTIYVIGDALVNAGADYRNMTFIGQGHQKSEIEISAAAQVDRCEFLNALVTGTLDADAVLDDCLIEDLSYFNGEIRECHLKPPGVITLGGGEPAVFVRCVTDSGTAPGDKATIDMGGSGQTLLVRELSGAIKIQNKTGTDQASIIMAGGAVFLDLDTMTAGPITIAGVADVFDMHGNRIRTGMYGSLNVTNYAVSTSEISDVVWEKVLP